MVPNWKSASHAGRREVRPAVDATRVAGGRCRGSRQAERASMALSVSHRRVGGSSPGGGSQKPPRCLREPWASPLKVCPCGAVRVPAISAPVGWPSRSRHWKTALWRRHRHLLRATPPVVTGQKHAGAAGPHGLGRADEGAHDGRGRHASTSSARPRPDTCYLGSSPTRGRYGTIATSWSPTARACGTGPAMP